MMDVRMAKIFFEKQWNFRDRISKAFYDYGRLCSAHPTACLSLSIVTTLFLSYPAISKVRLPISSPMDAYWGSGPSVAVSTNGSVPEWLYLPPTAFLQHIIVKGNVESSDSVNMTPAMAVKGSLSPAFKIQELLNNTHYKSNDKSNSKLMNLDSLCFRLPSNAAVANKLLPQAGSCLVFSPTRFWNGSYNKFLQDNNILQNIFHHPCSLSMCPRDILFGAPTRFTGIKPKYKTNRHRTIEYSITLLLSTFDASWRQSVIDELAKHFEIEKSRASDDETFIHVFYRPRKYFADYFPLFLFYFLCMLYFYCIVSKFEMVKNKWALALAAFITVFATLSSTAGICSYFELTPTLWGVGLYPYLAMVVGLENILCITRSVVYTPPTLDVVSRLSHGLSQEGFSISKYFIMELTFLLLGYITCVPEIQEFCTFAFIGLVVDFYMQLFFYSPCLTFDLQRLGSEEKRKYSMMLFNTDIKKLKNYSKLKCPAESIAPFLFTNRCNQFHRLSDTNAEEKIQCPARTHRRTVSTEKTAFKSETDVSFRLYLLYYWTKTRFFHRLLMIFFCFWVLWLAFIVHKWRLFDIWRSTTGAVLAGKDHQMSQNAYEGFGISHHLLETAPLEWSEWQRNTFLWWPALFGEYNISLSGQYVTFAPPIALRITIPSNDASLQYHPTQNYKLGDDSSKFNEGFNNTTALLTTENPELDSRINWLERQMTTMLVFSTLLPFSIVIGFVLYILWDRWNSYRSVKNAAAAFRNKSMVHGSLRNYVELTPLLFARHELPIEFAVVFPPNTIISGSLGGQILVWDATSGELKHTLNRSRNVSSKQSVSPLRTDRFTGTITGGKKFEANSFDEFRQRTRTLSISTDKNAFFDEAGDKSNSTRNNILFLSPQTTERDSLARSSFSGVSSMEQTTLENRHVRLQVWSVCARQSVFALGYSSGSFEMYSLPEMCMIAKCNGINSTAGVTHIQLVKHNRIVLARLNGVLESYEYSPVSAKKTSGCSFCGVQKLTLTRAHQKPVIQLVCTANSAITSSYDCTIKVFDVKSAMRLLHTLNGHDDPIISICADESSQMLYSCCETGLILCWDMKDGQLIKTLDNESIEATFSFVTVNTAYLLELDVTSELLLGFSSAMNILTIWNKFSGELITRMTPHQQNQDVIGFQAHQLIALQEEYRGVGRHLLVLNDSVAATSNKNFVYFWDVNEKELLKQVRLTKTIDSIYRINSYSLLCCSSANVYVVNLPSALITKFN